jgi:tetraacyldisaccharide 4'-kinase
MGDRKNILLYPLSLIYGLITGIRNFLYNTGILPSVEFSIPVICVGNITIGGTGKTPHTEYLAGLLSKDFKVATLSRGYKRKTRDFRIASVTSKVSEIGDEPMQIFRKYPDLLVAVERNRVKGVRKILETRPETEVIILDDGFQHRRITPGFSILLSDFERLIVRDELLPYGSLRESKINMRRADIILITKSPEDINPIQRRLIVKEIDKAPYQNLYFTSLTYQNPLPVFEENHPGRPPFDLQSCEGCSIVLITGIANPVPLLEYLNNFSGEVIHIPFPDHYNYKEKDVINISRIFTEVKSRNKYLLTTEKDAVRLREFTTFADQIRSVFFYVPVGIKFLNKDKDEFDNMIIDYVRKNKRNNRVSEC